MNTITIFPDRLTAMSEADLVALSPEQLHEVHVNLSELIAWVKAAQAKLHAAMQRRYAEQESAARAEASKDFGVIRIHDGPVRVAIDVPKRVCWDQTQLAEMARRIAASGDRVEDYIDVEFSVAESRFNNWPTALREQFAPARTVKPGKRAFELSVSDDSGVA